MSVVFFVFFCLFLSRLHVVVVFVFSVTVTSVSKTVTVTALACWNVPESVCGVGTPSVSS